jgi:hypothetical protein
LDTVEKFATEAIELLRQQPQTVAEIGEANVRHKMFAEKMAPMWSLLDKGEKKNRVLAAWTKEQVNLRYPFSLLKLLSSHRWPKFKDISEKPF